MAGLGLDASCALSLVMPDEAEAERIAVIVSTYRTATIWVPDLWWIETTNAVLMGERRGRITPVETQVAFEKLVSLATQEDGETSKHCRGRTLELARRHRLTIYDAAYVELAMRRTLDLATFDKAMRRAAEAEGVTVIE